MANNIVELIPEAPAPLQTVENGVQTGNELFDIVAPSQAAEPLIIKAKDGSELKWTPTELAYKDETGQLDYIVGSAPVSLQQINDHQIKYNRVFPLADDIFHIQKDGVKHWTILNEPPRSPAEYLGEGVKFGISGLVTGVELPQGVTDAIITDKFTLPQPVIKDLSGQEILGTYEVIGEQLFVWFDASYLAEATYPIMIDPTTIISSAYDTSGGGRKEVRLSNGWLIAVLGVSSNNDFKVYKSTDNGQTWTQLCYYTGTVLTGSICVASYGTNVYISIAGATASVRVVKFDAATVGNVELNNGTYTTTIASYSSLGWTHIVTDGAGAIYLAYEAKGGSYANSFNIYYTKSTNGGTSYSIVVAVTIVNTAGVDFTKPCIIIQGGQPKIACQWLNGANNYLIQFLQPTGGAPPWYCNTGWTGNAIISSGNYFQSNVSAAVDSSDNIYVGWHGNDSTDTSVYNIRVSKSTDGGTTWIKPSDNTAGHDKVTTGNSYQQQEPSLAFNPNNNDLYVLFKGIDSAISASYYNIRKKIFSAGAWGAVSTVTSNTTQSTASPIALWSKFNMNSSDAIRWIYMDGSTVKADAISLNTAPNAPTLTPVANFDATQAQTFAWTHNDPDAGDTQSAYQLVITKVSDGSTAYDSGKVASSTMFKSLTGATLTNNIQYQWKVKTWDSQDAASPYSSLGTFWTSAKPSASITYPAADAAVITTSEIVAQWSTSDPEGGGQGAYQLKLTDGADAVLWDSSKVSDIVNRSRSVGYTLVNGGSYKLKLTVWDDKDIVSSEVVRTFSASFTPPALPIITATPTGEKINVSVDNPTPQGAEPTVTRNDLYRRKTGETDWGRIAIGILNDGSYSDYNIESGVSYDYKVRAYGNNTTSSDSASASASVTLSKTWIHDADDPASSSMSFTYVTDKSEDWETEVALMEFAGRKDPVAEFGEKEKSVVRLKLKITDSTEWTTLRDLVKEKSILCLRDPRGRKVFGMISKLPDQDEIFGRSVDLDLTRSYYSEEV